PPPPPSPAADAGVLPPLSSPSSSAPSTPPANWSVFDIRPETAMKMLCRSVQTLANVTGDIPPTPPISRPSTPKAASEEPGSNETRAHHRSSSRPATPISSDDLRPPAFHPPDVGAPEASTHEPSVGSRTVAQAPLRAQHEAIARKFFSKRAPAIALADYLARLQRYCPMSTAVYLAAGAYICKLGVEERTVPVTARTVHRLVLAALRVAMKALEDLRYPQQRFAGVGGVSEGELKTLEISLCFLTGFELQVDAQRLYEKTVALQMAAEHASLVSGRLPDGFQPMLPGRRRR
ncbi:cyclin-domain-containing protein, partial [Eremomyces bilateralis CBS 781.70]